MTKYVISRMSVETQISEVNAWNIHSQIRNKDVLEFFKTPEFLEHSKKIAKAECHTMRHQLVISGEFQKYFSKYMMLTNVCFLDDSGANSRIDEELKLTVFDIFHHLHIMGAPQDDSTFKTTYTNHVLIPEGIICFIMEKFNLNYKLASEIFLECYYSND